jgi:CTP synthase (UTP-ammonia lyase)
VARIALVGDRKSSVVAHQAIPLVLERAAALGALDLEWSWVETPTLDGDVAERLAPFHGVWCVPASPYAHAAGALAAIQHAREQRVPFLGTCGGFQHSLLEYARAFWQIERPAHAETEPWADDPIIAPLACGLVEAQGTIHLEPGSRLGAIYGLLQAQEGYHCRYGLSPRFAHRLERGPLSVAARDENGDVRAVELGGHPFYFATLFQPERAGLAGRSHPLIEAFGRAVVEAANAGSPQH